MHKTKDAQMLTLQRVNESNQDVLSLIHLENNQIAANIDDLNLDLPTL